MKTHRLILIGLAFGLASCVGPPAPSPQVAIHAAGGPTHATMINGMMTGGGGMSLAESESEKSKAFFAPRR